jgi:hypothetical protein
MPVSSDLRTETRQTEVIVVISFDATPMCWSDVLRKSVPGGNAAEKGSKPL